MVNDYILHVLSDPAAVDASTWSKWYTTEHLPDMVYCGVSAAGQVYAKLDSPLGVDAPDEKRFFAVYHSNSPRQLDCKEYKEDVRHDSALWGYGKGAKTVGNFDIRNYQFIREFNPNNVRDGTPSCH